MSVKTGINNKYDAARYTFAQDVFDVADAYTHLRSLGAPAIKEIYKRFGFSTPYKSKERAIKKIVQETRKQFRDNPIV